MSAIVSDRARHRAGWKALLLIACGLLVSAGLSFAQTVWLGAAENVAILGGSTVTNTGGTIVSGNLALSPGTSVTGFPPGTITGGTIHINDTLATQAHADAASAFTQIGSESLTSNLSGIDLGGLTLTPGVYRFDSVAQLSGILTLDTRGDPNAAFHFQIGSTLTAALASSITLLNGSSVNIFWQVGTSATIGSSLFQGNIIAAQSITFANGARLDGRALALNGAVNLDTNAINGAAPASATASVWNGGTSNVWSGANWSSDVTRANTATLAPVADVIFSTVGGSPQNQNTTLDFDATISSLTVNDSVAVTISGSHTLAIVGSGPTSGITINSGAGLTTINSNVALSGTSQTIAVNNAAGMQINGTISGAIGLTKAGTGMLTLTASNSYTGTTTINAGTLNAGAAGSLGTTSNVIVNNGGTLLLSQSGSATTDRINNSSAITLNGGTLNTSGLSESNLSGRVVTPGMGALTLSSNSTIDLGNGASVIAFAGSSAQNWSGTLRIFNWSGTLLDGGGTDQIYFGTDGSGLTSTQLGQISFYSDGGTSFLGTAGFASGMTGEIVPVPEPATWLAGALTFGGLVLSQRRRLQALRAACGI